MGFDVYKFDTGEQEDSSWNQYLNVLYPLEEDLERIANMNLLDELVKKGDVLRVSREVQHWMSFRSDQSRALFREAAKGAGYGIVASSNRNCDALPQPSPTGDFDPSFQLTTQLRSLLCRVVQASESPLFFPQGVHH